MVACFCSGSFFDFFFFLFLSFRSRFAAARRTYFVACVARPPRQRVRGSWLVWDVGYKLCTAKKNDGKSSQRDDKNSRRTPRRMANDWCERMRTKLLKKMIHSFLLHLFHSLLLLAYIVHRTAITCADAYAFIERPTMDSININPCPPDPRKKLSRDSGTRKKNMFPMFRKVVNKTPFKGSDGLKWAKWNRTSRRSSFHIGIGVNLTLIKYNFRVLNHAQIRESVKFFFLSRNLQQSRIFAFSPSSSSPPSLAVSARTKQLSQMIRAYTN